MNKLHVHILLICLTLIACAHSSHSKNLNDFKGRWEVFELMSEDVETLVFPGHLRNAPWFEITVSKFSGFDGCNSFSGQWTQRSDKIKLEKGIQTLMACVSANAKDPIDYLINEAINRNPVFKNDRNGNYSIVTDLPPELRYLKVNEEGILEIFKSDKVMLRAKSIRQD